MVSILRVNTVLSSAQMETEGELVIAETPDDSSQNTEAVDTDQGVTPGLDNRPSRRMIRGGKNKDDQNVDEDADKGDSDEGWLNQFAQTAGQSTELCYRIM